MKVGDLYPVWWSTGRRDAHGSPLAEVLAVEPYRGRYTEFFNTVLRLRCPGAQFRGYLEMAVKL